MKTLMNSLLLAGALLLLSTPNSRAEGWQWLFDGESLDGWSVMGSPTWSVSDGAINVEGAEGEMGWLVHEGSYDNFVLRMRFKWQSGNSGIQFRSHLEDTTMIGYQANLDFSRDTATGSLVEENGRGLLRNTWLTARELMKPNDWNTYEISALGDRIVIYVNGRMTADLRDPDGDKAGFIALQMSPTAGASMQFTDIRILELPESADWVSLFDEDTLDGWDKLGDAIWDVEKFAIMGLSDELGYGWLVSEEEYRDFHFSTRFWVPRGNTGIQFRSWVVGDMVHGFQADLQSDSDWISGHLYDQSERGILVRPDRDFSQVINWLGWNTYEITAIGPKVELFINGIKSVEFIDPERDKAGVLAFQIHSNQEMATFWKDIRIIPLD